MFKDYRSKIVLISSKFLLEVDFGYVRCFKQYDLYDATIYRYTNNMGIFLQIDISREIVS